MVTRSSGVRGEVWDRNSGTGKKVVEKRKSQSDLGIHTFGDEKEVVRDYGIFIELNDESQRCEYAAEASSGGYSYSQVQHIPLPGLHTRCSAPR